MAEGTSWFRDSNTLLTRALYWIKEQGFTASSIAIGSVETVAVYTGNMMWGFNSQQTGPRRVDIGFILVNGQPRGLEQTFSPVVLKSTTPVPAASVDMPSPDPVLKGEYVRAVTGHYVPSAGGAVVYFVITEDFVCRLHQETPQRT